jgi:hypothetical protein
LTAPSGAIGSLIRNRSLSRSGGNILRSGDAAEAQMMTDWLCRQGEHRKIELEEIQTTVEMLRGMMVMDTQRAVMLGQRAVPDQAEITVRAKQCALLNGCVIR